MEMKMTAIDTISLVSHPLYEAQFISEYCTFQPQKHSVGLNCVVASKRRPLSRLGLQGQGHLAGYQPFFYRSLCFVSLVDRTGRV
ncbi:hypothetical protein TNCV_5018561 [Trichonephila clavipes]|nr:hypothetical protein TNCV_5018561 [Trichonephila clavipes]